MSPTDKEYQKLMNRPFEERLQEILYICYLEARKHGKRGTRNEHNVEVNINANLAILKDNLLNYTYTPSRSTTHIIYNPVIREIFAAPFRDRIIHHLIFRTAYKYWDDRFIEDSYSCRIGKGNLYGVMRLDYHIRSVSHNYKKRAWVYKFDIKGYFMSLPRKELLKVALKGLREQFKGKGIVIGNLTSQLLSNIYLDSLDKYIIYDLGYKHYGRYVDDFFIVTDDEHIEQLKKDVKAIETFLRRKGLTLHPKKRSLQDSRHGVAALGAVVYHDHIVLGRRLKKNLQATCIKYKKGEKPEESIVSYLGLCKYFNSRKTIKEIFDYVGLDYGYWTSKIDGWNETSRQKRNNTKNNKNKDSKDNNKSKR